MNRPDLLPKENTPLIDVAGFLTPGEVSQTCGTAGATYAPSVSSGALCYTRAGGSLEKGADQYGEGYWDKAHNEFKNGFKFIEFKLLNACYK